MRQNPHRRSSHLARWLMWSLQTISTSPRTRQPTRIARACCLAPGFISSLGRQHQRLTWQPTEGPKLMVSLRRARWAGCRPQLQPCLLHARQSLLPRCHTPQQQWTCLPGSRTLLSPPHPLLVPSMLADSGCVVLSHHQQQLPCSRCSRLLVLKRWKLSCEAKCCRHPPYATKSPPGWPLQNSSAKRHSEGLLHSQAKFATPQQTFWSLSSLRSTMRPCNSVSDLSSLQIGCLSLTGQHPLHCRRSAQQRPVHTLVA